MKMKETLRPAFEWLIRQKVMYSRGSTWLNFIGFATVTATSVRYGIEMGSLVFVGYLAVCVFTGHLEKRLGTWDYELDYTTRLNPYFRDLQKGGLKWKNRKK